MSWVITVIEALIAVILINVGNFVYIYPDGPYGVGHRQTVLKGGTTPPVSIFYPIPILTYKNHRSNEDKTSPLLLDGMKDIQGIIKGYEGIPSFLMRDYTLYRLKAINDANLHKDFVNKDKSLTPVIISHEIMGNRTSLAATAFQLASYGCIVYCLNHTDGSATYFNDQSKDNNQDIYYESYDKIIHKCSMAEFRQKQLTHRMKDIKTLIDFIKKEAKSEELNIDMSKLVALGYGMGGMTVIEMSLQFKEEFKLCVSLDPYYSAKADAILSSSDYALSQPLLILTNEDYPDTPFLADYDHKKVNEKLFSDTEGKNKSELNYDLTLDGTSHLCNADISLYYAIAFKFFGLIHPSVDVEDTYKKSMNIVTAFLSENEVLPVKYRHKVNAVIKK